jgi:hypothetical protein
MRELMVTALWKKYISASIQRFRIHFDEMKILWRTQGNKALIKRYGWKIFALVFCYYLIRDVTLYILIPYLFAKMSFGAFSTP